jgi:hypothetical protein
MCPDNLIKVEDTINAHAVTHRHYIINDLL